MKKLAILTSLAVLVAPSFTGGNAFSDLSKNQIKMVEGGETTSSYELRTGTIYFGEKDTKAGTQFTEENVKNYYKAEGFEEDNQPVFTTFNYCLSGGVRKNGEAESDCYSLRFGTGSNTANLELTFAKGLIVSSISVFAKAYSSGQTDGTFSVNLDGEQKGVSEKISDYTNWTECKFENLNNDSYNSFNKIGFKKVTTGSKNEFFSKIVFEYYVVDTSTTATVTYDYGSSVENSDFNTKSVEVTKGETVSSPLADGYGYTDWDGTRKLVGWYTDEEKTEAFDFATQITKDITLYAKWEVITDSTEVTNIKTSETKSQLYYEYAKGTYEYSTESALFGTDIDESGTKTVFDCTLSDGIKDTKLTTNGYAYRKSESHAIRMSTKSNNGTLTFTFKTATIVEKVVVHAIKHGSDSSKLAVSSSANTKGTASQSISATAFGDNDTYTFTGLDNDKKESSTSVALSATKRLYISKVEFVIASEVESTATTYSVSNIGLRFGGLVKQSYYDALKDHITNFGLIYATDLGDHETLTDALKDETFKNQTEYSEDATKGNVPYLTDIDGEKYYVFNAFFNVSTESINTVIYAIATLKFDNGTTIYFSEKSNSVVTIAKEYLATDAYDGLVKETLTALSNGKTVTESN